MMKATNRPSALMLATELEFALSRPSAPMLTRSVRSVRRSRTNTSFWPFASPGTRFDADDVNATNRPSALIATSSLSHHAPEAWAPALSTLTRSV